MTSKRTISAAAMLAVFFVSILLAPLRDYFFPLLVIAFGAFCLYEFDQLLRLRSLHGSFVFCALFAVLLVVDAWLTGLRHSGYILALLVVTLLMLRVLQSDYEHIAADVGASLLATTYIGMPMAIAVALARICDEQGVPLGVYHLLLVVCVVFGGDIAAYFAGRQWGRTPFFLHISPKKTLEGAAASVAVSLLIALLMILVIGPLWNTYGLRHGLIVGLLLGLVTPFGDLAESCFKRDAGRKDSGSDFTGHGGFLDLFDALLFALPVQFCYIQLVLANR